MTWRIKFVVQDIWLLASRFASVSFSHIWREANFLAHSLASLGHSLSAPSFWFQQPPLISSSSAFQFDQFGEKFAGRGAKPMGCASSNKARVKAGPSANLELNPAILASKTPFSVSEVESLYELYKKLSSSVVQDGLLHKEELQLALFQNSSKQNLFFDRIFDLFDVNNNGHIEFEEFVHTLSVFHPRTPDEVKITYAFKLYDLRHTGYIEREELKEMVVALLNESDLILSDDIVEMIVNKTFMEADGKADGRIDEEEWKEYVGKNPSLLKNMTIPYLMDISLSFPSFVLNTQAEESQL